MQAMVFMLKMVGVAATAAGAGLFAVSQLIPDLSQYGPAGLVAVVVGMFLAVGMSLARRWLETLKDIGKQCHGQQNAVLELMNERHEDHLKIQERTTANLEKLADHLRRATENAVKLGG